MVRKFVDVSGGGLGPVTFKLRREAETTFGRSYTVVFHDRTLTDFARDPSAGQAARLFLLLLGRLSHQQYRLLVQADVAVELGCSTATVSRALATLRVAGLVERKGHGPRQAWRLAIEASFRGSASTFHKLRREREA